jgi:hypothetical protein
MSNQYSGWGAEDQESFRTWLKSMLRMGPVEIAFTKKDGTERVMNASLEESKIPVYENKTGRTKAANDESLSVVDVDIAEWRAVRFDSIKQIRFTL